MYVVKTVLINEFFFDSFDSKRQPVCCVNNNEKEKLALHHLHNPKISPSC